MQHTGQFSIADERFSFELQDLGPQHGFAPCLSSGRRHHHISVRLQRLSDGRTREVFMHPVSDALMDVRLFIHSRVNFLLTAHNFEEIPERVDRPPDIPERCCLWC